MMTGKFNYLIIGSFLLLTACQINDVGESDAKETLSVDLSHKKQLKLWRFDTFLDLSGVDCDFYREMEENRKPYNELMQKLDRKGWKFEFISIEMDTCMNDSIFLKFKQLNEDVFGKKLKSVTMEEYLIIVKLK